jgi:hypothetical protein
MKRYKSRFKENKEFNTKGNIFDLEIINKGEWEKIK